MRIVELGLVSGLREAWTTAGREDAFQIILIAGDDYSDGL